MNTGINLPGSQYCGPEESLKAAAKAGFSHVSLSSPLAAELILGGAGALEEFKNLLGRYALKVDWIHVPFRETHFYHPHDEYRMHALTCALQCGLMAAELEANCIVCHPINIHFEALTADCTPRQIRERLSSVFGCLVQKVSAGGVQVAVENLRHPHSHRIMAQLIEDVPELVVCLDSGHSELTRSHDLYLGRLAERIRCLHLADNFGWEDDHLPPGDGAIDFAMVIARLRQAGYAGVWGVEIAMESTAREWTFAEYYQYARARLLELLDPA